MANLKKIIQTACDSPQNLRFGQLVTLIEEVGGYHLDHVDGSHWHFKRDGHYPIGITYSKGHAKYCEVRDVVKCFKEKKWLQ